MLARNPADGNGQHSFGDADIQGRSGVIGYAFSLIRLISERTMAGDWDGPIFFLRLFMGRFGFSGGEITARIFASPTRPESFPFL
jgi:hypothetical protein